MLRHLDDQFPQKWPKLAALIGDSETEVLSYLDFPEPHRSKLHSTNRLERPKKRSNAAPMSSGSWLVDPGNIYQATRLLDATAQRHLIAQAGEIAKSSPSCLQSA